MTQFVRESLHVVRLHAGRVNDDVVCGWSDSALPHRLTHQEEVVPEQTKQSTCMASRHITQPTTHSNVIINPIYQSTTGKAFTEKLHRTSQVHIHTRNQLSVANVDP